MIGAKTLIPISLHNRRATLHHLDEWDVRFPRTNGNTTSANGKATNQQHSSDSSTMLKTTNQVTNGVHSHNSKLDTQVTFSRYRSHRTTPAPSVRVTKSNPRWSRRHCRALAWGLENGNYLIEQSMPWHGSFFWGTMGYKYIYIHIYIYQYHICLNVFFNLNGGRKKKT